MHAYCRPIALFALKFAAPVLTNAGALLKFKHPCRRRRDRGTEREGRANVRMRERAQRERARENMPCSQHTVFSSFHARKRLLQSQQCQVQCLHTWHQAQHHKRRTQPEPPQSLQRDRMRLCSQMLEPPQSLHWCFNLASAWDTQSNSRADDTTQLQGLDNRHPAENEAPMGGQFAGAYLPC